MQRTAKLFRNGRSQAVRIPREWELPGDSVTVERLNDGIFLRPKRNAISEMIDWLRSQPPLGPEDQLPEIEDSPPPPVNCFDDWVGDEDEKSAPLAPDRP